MPSVISLFLFQALADRSLEEPSCLLYLVLVCPKKDSCHLDLVRVTMVLSAGTGVQSAAAD